MPNFHNSVNKINRLAGVCFENSLRLHLDAIRLYKYKSYASALALSILAMEELSKAYIFEDIAWHAVVDGVPIDSSLVISKSILQSHKIKHKVFTNRVFSLGRIGRNNNIERKGNVFWKTVQSDRLERLKQQALYADLTFKDRKGVQRISNPAAIKHESPKKIITIINDYLIDLAVGILGDWYVIDSEFIAAQIHRSLLRKLIKTWPYRGLVGIEAIKLAKKHNIS